MKKYKNRNWLDQKYWQEELSMPQISKLCSCGKTTIYDWLKRFNIPTRSRSEYVHLAKTNHCNLTEGARQWIDGELLGDGCLTSYSKWSASFSYTSKYLKYINYISDTLNSFGIKQSGRIYKRYYKEFDCYAYNYCSLCYVELLPIRKRWYPDKKKIIPRDLKLTPLTLRQEHIGDGCLKHPKDSSPYIQLYTNGFPINDVEWLIGQLNKLGFKSTRKLYDNSVYISTKSTKQFLDYIGDCPVECYSYKWNINKKIREQLCHN